MPEPAVSATPNAVRKRLARRAADRRQAVTLLQIAGCTVEYAISQLSNGAEPEEARRAALFVAGELVSTGEALRRLTRLSGPERRGLAVRLSKRGVGTKQIAAQLGVSERAVRYYITGRPCPNHPSR
jgi:DNA-binding NarL/FixJ family response regulator